MQMLHALHEQMTSIPKGRKERSPTNGSGHGDHGLVSFKRPKYQCLLHLPFLGSFLSSLSFLVQQENTICLECSCSYRLRLKASSDVCLG